MNDEKVNYVIDMIKDMDIDMIKKKYINTLIKC